MVHPDRLWFGPHILIHFSLGIPHHLGHHLSLLGYLLFQEVEPKEVLEIVWVPDRQMMRITRLERLGVWIFILCVNLVGDIVRNTVGVIYMIFLWSTGQGWLWLLLFVSVFLIPFFVLLNVGGQGSKGSGKWSFHPPAGSCLWRFHSHQGDAW